MGPSSSLIARVDTVTINDDFSRISYTRISVSGYRRASVETTEGIESDSFKRALPPSLLGKEEGRVVITVDGFSAPLHSNTLTLTLTLTLTHIHFFIMRCPR